MIDMKTLSAMGLAAALAWLSGCATPLPPVSLQEPVASSTGVASAASGSAPTSTPSPTASGSSPASPDIPTARAPAQTASSSGVPSPAQEAAASGATTPAASPSPPLPSASWRARLLAMDPQAAARVDLWERIRAGYAMPDVNSDLVRKWEQWYSARPDYVERMMDRGSRYLFHIVEEVDNRGLPMELALLPFIESAFNPQALSTARAAGMWQFMPATGKEFELRQNVFRDDRRDVLASTRAALEYLQSLHKMFGDWHLALAAYNWGQGNVQRAITRRQRQGQTVAYESLTMPDETRNYVPKLQAIKNIVSRPEAYGLKLPALENHPFFLTVEIERDVDVELAARLAGLTLEEFQALNPQMNQPVILAAGVPRILLPYENANRFIRALSTHIGPTASWTAWVAPKTMRPSEAAKLTGMSEARLREINRIPSRMLVKSGSTLIVPRNKTSQRDVSVDVAQNGRLALSPEATKKPATKKGPVKGRKQAQTAQKNKPTQQATAKSQKSVLNKSRSDK